MVISIASTLPADSGKLLNVMTAGPSLSRCSSKCPTVERRLCQITLRLHGISALVATSWSTPLLVKASPWSGVNSDEDQVSLVKFRHLASVSVITWVFTTLQYKDRIGVRLRRMRQSIDFKLKLFEGIQTGKSWVHLVVIHQRTFHVLVKVSSRDNCWTMYYFHKERSRYFVHGFRFNGWLWTDSSDGDGHKGGAVHPNEMGGDVLCKICVIIVIIGTLPNRDEY